VLYAAGICFLFVALLIGSPYYATSVSERPHSSMHAAFKPGGVWGHGLGIIGSTMIVLLLLYSLRKRGKLGLRFGRTSRWLDIHIFFGIMGPLLITLHTAMKFGGIVSISYFSMMAVMLSGIFGRYVYMQIPRDPRGHTMSLEKIKERIGELHDGLEADVSPQSMEEIRSVTNREFAHSSTIGVLVGSLWDDFALRAKVWRLRRYLRRHESQADANVVREMATLAKEQSLFQRRIASLNSMNRMFHYWHVFHMPFAFVMLRIMVLHIAVTVAFGYRWIF